MTQFQLIVTNGDIFILDKKPKHAFYTGHNDGKLLNFLSYALKFIKGTPLIQFGGAFEYHNGLRGVFGDVTILITFEEKVYIRVAKNKDGEVIIFEEFSPIKASGSIMALQDEITYSVNEPSIKVYLDKCKLKMSYSEFILDRKSLESVLYHIGKGVPQSNSNPFQTIMYNEDIEYNTFIVIYFHNRPVAVFTKLTDMMDTFSRLYEEIKKEV